MNPTNEHREQAREIETRLIDLFTEEATRLHKVPGAFTNRLAHIAARSVASALSSRDREVREVLEGLATYRNPQCWCPPGTETEPHSEACRAATALYTKLQPK